MLNCKRQILDKEFIKKDKYLDFNFEEFQKYNFIGNENLIRRMFFNFITQNISYYYESDFNMIYYSDRFLLFLGNLEKEEYENILNYDKNTFKKIFELRLIKEEIKEEMIKDCLEKYNHFLPKLFKFIIDNKICIRDERIINKLKEKGI